jgi:purine catabolism regulator
MCPGKFAGHFSYCIMVTELSLNELIRLGLSGEFRILAGHSQLHLPVTWVNTVSGARPYDPPPTPTGFILLAPPYVDLRNQLRQLQQHQGAGVALLQNELTDDLIAWAEAAAFPLISLPEGVDLARVQRDLLRLLVSAEAEIIAREAEIYQRLTRLSLDNQGIEGIARALAELVQKGVVVHDKRLDVLAAIPPPASALDWQNVVEWLSAPNHQPKQFHDRKRASEIEGPLEQEIESGGARLTMPIIVQDVARGFLSLVHTSAEFDRLDRMVLEQGAAACALEMAKAKAVSEAQKRMTGDLIEAVLSNSIGEVDAARWATRAHYRRTGPHVSIVMQWASRDAPTFRRLETIVSGEVKRMPTRALALARENEIVVFYALHPERGLDDAREWAQRIYDAAHSEFPGVHLALGIGRPTETLLDLRHSYRQAAQAMAIERKLRQNRPQYFGDLGIYRLLLQLEGSPELNSFANEMLGTLVEYDRAQGTNLVETLRAYFQHNANLAQTAQALYIHRNTLLYRLERASDIGKFDLDNPDTRLAIQLALRAYELSRDDAEFLPPL